MKNKIRVMLVVLIAILYCMGCGKEEAQSNIELGFTAIETLEYEQALGYFEQATVAGEDEREICRGQGIAYLGLTNYESAIANFERCLEISSSIPDAMVYDINYYLATAYYKTGRLEDAKKVYDAVLSMKDKEHDAYFLRGSVLLELGDYEKARLDFDKAISLMPTNYDQIVAIYEVLEKFGYREVGNEYLQGTLEASSKDMSNYDKGRMYFYLEDFESARNYLEQARDAGDAQAAYYLGRTWEALGEYNYAASVYSSYLKDQDESALIYNQLALCQMQLKEYDAALAAIEEGLKLEDASLKQTLLYNQIVIYEFKGNFKKAATLMGVYVKNYPDDAEAQREYEFLKTR